MTNQQATKPHRVKWAEAERELAIRGVYPSTFLSDPDFSAMPPTVPEGSLSEMPDGTEVSP